MRYTIYLDESGDLGFNFSHPYQQGGSSRYITISAIVLPQAKIPHLERVIRNIYKRRKRQIKNELKSTDLSTKDINSFLQSLHKIASQHTDIHFYSIAIDKQRAKTSLREDGNTLYNYAVKKMLLHAISQREYVDFIPDNRSEKTYTRWNLSEYMRHMLLEMELEHGIAYEQ